MGGFGATLTAFANAALVIVLLMFLLALAIATAQERVIATLRAHVGEVKRWGGWILTIVGAWFIILAVFAHFFARVFSV
jgi:cytochrome c biogenesis protein CcdA